MTKVKTYWDEIKNEESYYYGGTRGWEIPLRWVDVSKYDNKTHKTVKSRSLQFVFPFSSGDGVSSVEKALTRKEVKLSRQKEKMLAQASRNVEEFRELRSRVYGESWGMIASTGLKGFDLARYIQNTFITQNEANSLFYRM